MMAYEEGFTKHCPEFMLGRMPPRSSHASSSLRPLPVRHLPFLRQAIEELGIPEIIDRLSPADPRHLVSDGECAIVMILNILGGRVTLYEMASWLEDTDVELLLGEGADAAHFHDDRLGHCLDRLFSVGTEFIFSEVAQGVLQRPEIGTEYHANLDTTSITLEGAYVGKPNLPDIKGTPPVPARGYSKDHRPDLKQLIFGLTLHGPSRIPLGFSILDGNTADPKANRFQVESLCQLLPRQHEVTLVADCKFVDAETLGASRRSGFHYVSLLPKTFNLREELVERLRTQPVPMTDLGGFPGRKKSDPLKVYKGVAMEAPLQVKNEDTGKKEAIPHRFLVIRSSTQEEEFESTIGRHIENEAEKIKTSLEKFGKKTYACLADLEAGYAEVVAGLKYHEVKGEFGTVPLVKKREKSGRPSKNESPPAGEMVWKLLGHNVGRDETRIEKARFHAAHFILVTDHMDQKKWDERRIFETYRSQESIEGHAGFRWLKGVAEVAPVFLKQPERIQALSLIFMLALMVRNWMEAKVRLSLKETGKKLPNFNDQLIVRPTAENILYLFRAVSIIAHMSGGKIESREVHFLEGYAHDVLAIFGFGEELFLRPRRKSPHLAAG